MKIFGKILWLTILLIVLNAIIFIIAIPFLILSDINIFIKCFFIFAIIYFILLFIFLLIGIMYFIKTTKEDKK